MNPSPEEVAAARFGLARALWARTEGWRPRALAEARKARDALRTLGARGSVALAEVELAHELRAPSAPHSGCSASQRSTQARWWARR